MLTQDDPIIDACVHHAWPGASESAISEYMPDGWTMYVNRPDASQHHAAADRTLAAFEVWHTRRTLPDLIWTNPQGDHRADLAREDGDHPASSPSALDERLLRPHGVARALLLHDRAMFIPAGTNPFLVDAFCSALNDWTIREWLERDERLYGAIVANTQTPERGAAEIRRVGGHPKLAAVVLAVSPSGKFFGHPMYWPIIEAAAESGLPLVIHRGGDAVHGVPAAPAGGPPYTFAEYVALAPSNVANHMLSFMTNGVFERFPSLQICLAGAGLTWIPGFLRRADAAWRAQRVEVPWMVRAPREYFKDHVRVTTYGLEAGSGGAELLRRFLEAHRELQDTLVFGSGHPSWDTSYASELEDVLPSQWRQAVMFDNADRLFRWASEAALGAQAAQGVR
jgi:predicted TIM-barrel fold metal-dependent hydrolase